MPEAAVPVSTLSARGGLGRVVDAQGIGHGAKDPIAGAGGTAPAAALLSAVHVKADDSQQGTEGTEESAEEALDQERPDHDQDKEQGARGEKDRCRLRKAAAGQKAEDRPGTQIRGQLPQAGPDQSRRRKTPVTAP